MGKRERERRQLKRRRSLEKSHPRKKKKKKEWPVNPSRVRAGSAAVRARIAKTAARAMIAATAASKTWDGRKTVTAAEEHFGWGDECGNADTERERVYVKETKRRASSVFWRICVAESNTVAMGSEWTAKQDGRSCLNGSWSWTSASTRVRHNPGGWERRRWRRLGKRMHVRV